MGKIDEHQNIATALLATVISTALCFLIATREEQKDIQNLLPVILSYMELLIREPFFCYT